VNPIERAVRVVDRSQQRFGPAGFAFGVVKKFGDDRGGSLAALLTFYGFLSLFPLLLLLVTILGLVFGNNKSVTHDLETSALSQFPVIGTQLGDSIKALHRNSEIGLIIGILGLLWGSQGAAQSGQYAMAEIWNVPGVVRPNFWSRLARTFLLMGTLGVFLLLSTASAAISSFLGGGRTLEKIGGVALTLLLNIVLYVVAFRILTPKQVASRVLLLGSILGGIGWTVLQLAGGLLIHRALQNTSEVYGFFAIVLGFMAWIYLGAQMTLYMAELNVVRERRLWPRSIVQPPLTAADLKVLSAIAHQGERRPEQQVSVHFEVPDETPAPDPVPPENPVPPDAAAPTENAVPSENPVPADAEGPSDEPAPADYQSKPRS
jgi:YihY family inner membrane protein